VIVSILNQTTGIWKPFAWVIGKIFNWIYDIVSNFSDDNTANVAVCLIILTIVVKILMTPLTIKQQKYTKLQSVMSPELTAIQEKYKGKTDEDSKRRMMNEQQTVYEKYGASPTAGCLPLLITLPIMFGLYRVIYSIPAYVTKIFEMFRPVAEGLQKIDTEIAVLNVKGKTGFIASQNSIENIIDILKDFNGEKWTELATVVANQGMPELAAQINTAAESILEINSFLGMSLLDQPSSNFPSWALLIPILSVVTQYIQTWVSKLGQPARAKADPDNTMAQSMESMTKIMPLMSGVFCFMFPICIGVYWIINTVTSIVQTYVINKYIDRIGIDNIIAKNVAKQEKKREKIGIMANGDGKMTELAKARTKALQGVNTATAEAPKKSISEYAGAGKSHYDNADQSKKTTSSENKEVKKGSISDYANYLNRKDGN